MNILFDLRLIKAGGGQIIEELNESSMSEISHIFTEPKYFTSIQVLFLGFLRLILDYYLMVFPQVPIFKRNLKCWRRIRKPAYDPKLSLNVSFGHKC